MTKKKVIENPIKSVNKVINLIPGTLVYKGGKKDEFTIEKIEYSANGFEQKTYGSLDHVFVDDIKASKDNSVKWINVTGINNIEEIRKIGRFFDIDNLLLEQILDISKHSLYKVSDKTIFNHLQMIYLNNGVIVNETLCVYLVDNIIMTFQERKGDVFESIRQRLINNEGHIRSENANYTYFSFLDAIVDHYINVLEDMKSSIEIMELKLMEDQQLDNKELHLLRKHILIMRLSAAPIDKLVQEILLIETSSFVKQKVYFESLSQHLKLTMHEVSVLKESVDSLYENYMMTNANDMNQIMTILTIFSAIFIPLSFVAGVFGMNFSVIPGLNNPLAFIYFLVGCGATALGMLLVFKLKKWF